MLSHPPGASKNSPGGRVVDRLERESLGSGRRPRLASIPRSENLRNGRGREAAASDQEQGPGDRPHQVLQEAARRDPVEPDAWLLLEEARTRYHAPRVLQTPLRT